MGGGSRPSGELPKVTLRDGTRMEKFVVDRVTAVLDHLRQEQQYEALKALYQLATKQKDIPPEKPIGTGPFPYISTSARDTLREFGLIIPSTQRRYDGEQNFVLAKDVAEVVKNAVTPNVEQPFLTRVESPVKAQGQGSQGPDRGRWEQRISDGGGANVGRGTPAGIG